MCVGVCVRVCVCACLCERERECVCERESVCVYFCVWECLCVLPEFIKLVICETAANTSEAWGNKIRVMRHSHLRLCVLDAVSFAAEQFFAGTFWRYFTEPNSERACIRTAWVCS